MFNRLNLRDDRGVAMITVIMVMAVLLAVGTAAVVVSTDNMKNAGRDRFATNALGAAEAAVSAAESYLQTTNPQALLCSPNCTTNPWGYQTAPETLSFPGNRSATVWIETKQAYAPPNYKSGDYVIHAVGKDASALSVRTIDEEVTVKPLDFPFGIYIDNKINDQGTPGVTNESMFSSSCIDSRNKIQFVGTDPFYNIPAAAHSTQYITTANQTSCNTNLTDEQKTDQKAIHYDPTGGSQDNYCNPTYPYDQDALGGDFSLDATDGSQCTSGALNPPQYWSTSKFTSGDLITQYNYTPGGLTSSEYALLKSIAQSEGHYYTSVSSIVWPNASSEPDPVMYFDLSPGKQVNVGATDVASYAWQDEPGGTCVASHPAMLIVVRGGDLSLGSGTALTGAIFVPEGQITIAGGVNLVGTVFAAYAKVTGSANLSLNSCYVKNLPGPLLGVTPVRFHEVDR